MKKIAFFSTPAYGHILSIIPVIKSLIDKGYNVECYSTKKFKKIIEKTGATYIEYEFDFESCMLNEITSNFFNLTKALIEINRQAYTIYELRILEKKFDLILYDSMCSFAKNIAKKHKIKSICFVTTLGFNLPIIITSNLGIPNVPLFFKNRKTMKAMIKEENQFRKENNLAKLDLMDLFMNKGDETIIFSFKEFQPLSWTFFNKIHFVGTTIKEREILYKEEKENYEQYDYYISLGTIFTENKAFLQDIINHEFLEDKNLILSAGNLEIDNKRENITISKMVNQIRLLPHCRYFVNHAGINSVYESLYYKVPQICIPQQEEQKYVAKIVNQKKIGIYKPNNKNVFKEIEKFNGSKRIEKMSKIVRKYDGTGLATKIIVDFLERN